MKTIVKTYSIPMEMLMDILKIVLKNDLPSRIEGINIKENMVRLSVKFETVHPFFKDIKENIEMLLDDYGLFTGGSPDDFDSRLSHDEQDFSRLT